MIYLWNHIIDLDIQNYKYEGVFYEKGSDVLFYFADDDCNIIHCNKYGKEHWKKRIYGYLYTEIYTYRDRYIFFGTDGCGGRFYEIDMKTGEFCAEINTGGLCQLIIDNDLCYFLNRKTHEIVIVSLSDGMIRDTIRLMGKVYEWSRLFLHDKKLYAVSFVKKQGKEYACMNCVSLS